jgi:DNA-binding transcriptional LysR family regulator
MNLSQLRYLVAAADQPTMTAAASSLHVSQPVLSRAIRSLEREVGVQVFVKSGRNVSVTPAGLAVVEAARSALDALAPLQALAEQAHTQRQVLQVASTSSLAISLGRRTAAALREAENGLSLRFIRAEDIQDVFAMVLANRADIGLSDTEPPESIGPLRWQPVSTSEAVLVCPAVYDLPDPFPISRIAEVPLILPTQEHRRRHELEQWAGRHATALRATVETDDRSAWPALAVDGHGAYLTYMDAVAHLNMAGLRIYRLEPAPRRSVGVVYRAGERREAVRRFLAGATSASSPETARERAGSPRQQ